MLCASLTIKSGGCLAQCYRPAELEEVQEQAEAWGGNGRENQAVGGLWGREKGGWGVGVGVGWGDPHEWVT